MRLRSVLAVTCTPVVCILVISTLLASPAHAQADTHAPYAWPEHPSAQAFLEVLEAIRNHYIIEDIDENALWQAAMAGMVDALPDRWSHYLDPKENADLQAAQARSYSGIGTGLEGIYTHFDGTYYTTPVRVMMRDLWPGGPAELAGLREGDVVLEVDSLDMRSAATSAEVAGAVRGEAGTTVRILVERAGVPGPLAFDVVRDAIPIEIADSMMLPDDVGYLALHTFFQATVHFQFLRHLRALEAAGATALIIDLRDNDGGDPEQGIRVLDELLAPDQAWLTSSRGQTTVERTLSHRANDLPLVVLVNSRTISMGELAAAVLQAQGRALIVGERTAGKGLRNLHLTLADGGLLVLSDSELTAHDGKSIEGIGVIPDIWVPDKRRPAVVTASGLGAQDGQLVELSIDGMVVASTLAGDGGFHLVGSAPLGNAVEATSSPADPSTDTALQVAVEAVKQLREGAPAVD